MAPIDLRLAAITGARRSELAALRWEDLDGSTLTIDSAIVAVREGKGETLTTEIRDQPTKTGDRRRVTLDPETLAVLAEQRTKRLAVTEWMFSDTDRPPNPVRVGYWRRRARALAKIDVRWRLHDLRHWSASSALSGGFDLAAVAQRLGHSDPSVTLRVYSHALAERDVEVAACWLLSERGKGALRLLGASNG